MCVCACMCVSECVIILWVTGCGMFMCVRLDTFTALVLCLCDVVYIYSTCALFV